MEKYAANVKIKISCQNWEYGFMLSLSIIFYISKFSRITENWVEDAITFSVKIDMP